MIRVEPADTPVTMPLLGSTAAMTGLALDHVTGLLPFSVTPDEFLSVTLAGTVCPMVSRDDVRLTAISAIRLRAEFTPTAESLLHATTATTAAQATKLRASKCIFN